MNYIYKFTNLINQKLYIGSTITDPQKRYNQHIYVAFHPNTHQYNYPLYQAFRKYGIENFAYEIIEQRECSEEEIRLLEKEYIIKYNSLSPNGYNQTIDTEHPINSIETYAKIRNTKRNQSKNVVELNAENEILKEWRSIVDCSEDTGLNEKKIAAVCRGEAHTVEQRKFAWIENGKPIIPKYTGPLYRGKKGSTQIQSTSRKVAKIDKQTLQVIAEYDTVALAGRENNIDASAISKVCRGLRKTTGGFLWKYID